MEILDKWPKFNPNHVRNTSPYVWSSAALETLPVCVFMFPVTARTRVEYTFFFHQCVEEYFFGKHDRLCYLVIQVASINTFQSTIANFAHKARKNCFPLSQ